MKKLILLPAFLISMMVAYSQETFPLYPGPIPNSKAAPDREVTQNRDATHISVSKISRPTMAVYLAPADKANGTSVIVFPGGGYANNAIGHEGYAVAKALNQLGVSAFVVKYRIPDDSTMINKEIGPLQDAQRAIQIVRERAGEWKLNPAKVGIMGFSAGGHLASTAGTHFTKSVIENKANTSLRPDFMILLYPVISFNDSIAHIGSRKQLIGLHPAADKIREYSNELQVTSQTPPTFLVHAGDDVTVKVQNSIDFYLALLKNKVPAEMHIYPKGGHGFGMENPTTSDRWMDRLANWLNSSL